MASSRAAYWVLSQLPLCSPILEEETLILTRDQVEIAHGA